MTFRLEKFNVPPHPNAAFLVTFITNFVRTKGPKDFFSDGGVAFDAPENFELSEVLTGLFALYGWKVIYDMGAWSICFDALSLGPEPPQNFSRGLIPTKRLLKALTTEVLAWVRSDFINQFRVSTGEGGIVYHPPGGDMVFGRAYVMHMYYHARIVGDDGFMYVYL